MKITYIGHSGFAVEFSRCTLLFDYYEGVLPAFDPEKPLYVFSSHAHRDHFSFEIFKLFALHPDVRYILSRDIRRKWSPSGFIKKGVPDAAVERITFLGAHEKAAFPGLAVETLESTDEGVAFLVSLAGKTVFHAGDLNDWVWDGEPESGNAAMTARFRKEIDRLAGRRIDAAFIVLDPRQEADFYRGLDYFMRRTDAARVYPMHFWHDPSVFERLRALPCSEPYRDRIAPWEEYNKIDN